MRTRKSTPATIAMICSALRRLPAEAQSSSAAPGGQPPSAEEHPIADAARFPAGYARGFGMHEGGHLIFDTAFNPGVRLAGIRFRPFPLFAITHPGDLSPRRQVTISSTGF